MSKIYAKIYYKDGKPIPETLEEHTKNLLKELERLKKLYEKEISLDNQFWENLKLACLFHDLGKLSFLFQKKLKKVLGKTEKVPQGLNKEIPHNFLSGIFFYSKEVRKLIPKEFYDYIFYSVVFHHDREIDFDKEYLTQVLEKDISKKSKFLTWLKEFGINIESIDYKKAGLLLKKIEEFKYNRHKTKTLKKEKHFILLKGLLHRLDHSASAHLPVEEEKINNIDKKLNIYIKNKKNSKLKPFQEKAKDLRDKNILLTASTGMGKTEFAINWIGNSKAFYTLPVRVSVNAMYERFKEIFEDYQEKIGLLHSDAIFYGLDSLKSVEENLSEENLSIEEHIIRTQTTRQFSMPITITTADQLFTSVLKYPGYEKIYATLTYSKIILDEPQSYLPETLAIIIKGLQEISNYGGKFCVMSATVHPFIKENLKNCPNFVEIEPVFDTTKRHKIKLLNKSIEDENILNEIIKLYQSGKKVLIILNTVKKSQEVFKKLKAITYKNINIKLLHSLFIRKDRQKKEKQIKKDFINKKPVIWITTQLIEASLDIDYDVLFTEITTLDSLIQRMGRVYRRKGRNIDETDNPNIYVLTQNPSDKGKIYNTEIINLTKMALEKYDEQILLDKDKQNLMEEVFNTEKIKKTAFYKKFEDNLKLLEFGYEADNKKDAQKIFREILNLDMIPENVYQKNLEEIENLIQKILDKNLDKIEKLLSIQKLSSFSLSLPFFRLKNKFPTSITPKGMKQNLFIVSFDYDDELGLRLDKEKEDIDFL